MLMMVCVRCSFFCSSGMVVWVVCLFVRIVLLCVVKLLFLINGSDGVIIMFV